MSIEICAKCSRCGLKTKPVDMLEDVEFKVPKDWSTFEAHGAKYHLCSTCAACVQRFILCTGIDNNWLINPDGYVQDPPIAVPKETTV